jgi:hypothetical protein
MDRDSRISFDRIKNVTDWNKRVLNELNSKARRFIWQWRRRIAIRTQTINVNESTRRPAWAGKIEMQLSPTGVNRVYTVDDQWLKGQHQGQHFLKMVYIVD